MDGKRPAGDMRSGCATKATAWSLSNAMRARPVCCDAYPLPRIYMERQILRNSPGDPVSWLRPFVRYVVASTRGKTDRLQS
jgi:hypothetical protein